MNYHLIGICGVSMSGIAKLLQAQGNRVTGSDLDDCKFVIPSDGKSRVEESLDKSDFSTEASQMRLSSRNDKKNNIKIYKGHSEKNITKDIDEVIYTVAIDSPTATGYVELKKARELGIKCTNRAKFLGRFMNDKIGITVSGMHGKTTVSTMISLILEEAGFNPTCFIGSEVKEWESNVRIPTQSEKLKTHNNGEKLKAKDKIHFGKLSEYVVAEACEYQKQMLDFRPKIAVVTNLEAEHLDTYKNGMKDIRQAFKKFIRMLPPNGLLVVWQEDKNLMPLTKAAKCKVKRVSLKNPWPGLQLKIPGKFNQLNAAFAARVCHELGVSHKIIKKVLNNFTGAARRFEIKGEKNGVLVIDDYGHHPTEIKNAIAGAKEKYPDRRLIVVFQPHQQQRTKLLFNDFAKTFDEVDKLIITDVYLIAGREKDTGENLAKKLAEEIKKRNVDVKYIDSANNYQKIVDYLTKNTKKGDLVITQGATDIYKVGEELLK